MFVTIVLEIICTRFHDVGRLLSISATRLCISETDVVLSVIHAATLRQKLKVNLATSVTVLRRWANQSQR